MEHVFHVTVISPLPIQLNYTTHAISENQKKKKTFLFSLSVLGSWKRQVLFFCVCVYFVCNTKSKDLEKKKKKDECFDASAISHQGSF